MPVPAERLRSLRDLEAPAAEVRRAVDGLLAAAHEPESPLSVSEGVGRLEAAVEQWLQDTDSIEGQLRADAEGATGDRYDAEARLGGLGLAHLSIAGDVASVAPLDELGFDDRVSGIEDPSRLLDTTDSSREVLLDGGLLRTLSEPIEAEDEGTPIAGASPQAPRVPPNAERIIDEVIEDILARAGGAGIAIVMSLIHPLGTLMTHLTHAIDMTPAHIQTAFERSARRIANLVKRLVQRALKIFDWVTGDYHEAARETLAEAAEDAAEPFGARVMSRLLKADGVPTRAMKELERAGDPDECLRRVEKLKRLHGRWVGPVRWVAKCIPKLWAVMIGPVPAGAVATVALLAYTVVVTGDQLDSERVFIPDLWPGVVERAGGR